MEKQKEISYGTRYPQAVLEEMRRLAELHGRSLNREIIWALQRYIVGQREKHSDPGVTVNDSTGQAIE